MNCPFCDDENIELVETYAENAGEKGPAVECGNCGLRGPVGQDDDHAWDLFGRIVIVANTTTPGKDE
jgi:uncharacterized Zn finger protein